MNNYTGSPEQLAKIAQAMGKANVSIYKGHVRYSESLGLGSPEMMHYSYNPSTNAEQAYEIEEYLFNLRFSICKTSDGLYRVVNSVNIFEAKTRAEAVLSAIWSVINNG